MRYLPVWLLLCWAGHNFTTIEVTGRFATYQECSSMMAFYNLDPQNQEHTYWCIELGE